MTTYKLYRFYPIDDKPYYLIEHEGKYSATTIDKANMELSLFMMKEASTPPEGVEEVATFTSYENLITNYPELLL